MKQSYFDGGLLKYIGWIILGVLITIFTLGICFPWALCMVYGWRINHTVIGDKRLKFKGTAWGLFGNWIKWWLLCIITLGIYSYWLFISLNKWLTKNTVFQDEDKLVSHFDGGLFNYLWRVILGVLITFFTLGLGFPWALCLIYRWRINNTVIEGNRLEFKGTALGLIGNWIKWWFLTLITCGIYGFWVFIALIKWETKHTIFKGQESEFGLVEEKLDKKTLKIAIAVFIALFLISKIPVVIRESSNINTRTKVVTAPILNASIEVTEEIKEPVISKPITQEAEKQDLESNIPTKEDNKVTSPVAQVKKVEPAKIEKKVEKKIEKPVVDLISGVITSKESTITNISYYEDGRVKSITTPESTYYNNATQSIINENFMNKVKYGNLSNSNVLNSTIIELLVEIKNKNKTSEDEAKINIVKEIINKKLNEL